MWKNSGNVLSFLQLHSRIPSSVRYLGGFVALYYMPRLLRRFKLLPPTGRLRREKVVRPDLNSPLLLSSSGSQQPASALSEVEENMSAYESKSNVIDLAFGRTHYYEVDSASSTTEPTVVLLHGYSTSSHCWHTFAHGLAAMTGHRMVYYDLYGRGWSDSPDCPFSPDLFVAQLLELLHALRLRRVILVGLSMGAVVATDFAARYPNMVTKLVLISPAGPSSDFGCVGRMLCQLPILGDVLFECIAGYSMNDYQSSMLLTHDANVLALQKVFSDRMTQQLTEHPGYLRSLLSTLRHFPFHDTFQEFHKAGQHPRPVLLLWGTKDLATPFTQAEVVQSLMPRASLVTLTDVGHWAFLEKQTEAIDAVAKFVLEKN